MGMINGCEYARCCNNKAIPIYVVVVFVVEVVIIIIVERRNENNSRKYNMRIEKHETKKKIEDLRIRK